MVAWATCWEPTQIMPSERPFNNNIISGIIVIITRATNNPVLVRSRLAISKRPASSSCLLKARMTIMPERFSRVTRFILSMSSCINLNFGTEIENTIRINPRSTMTARAISHHMLGLLSIARITPPTPMIGANKTILMNMKITC